MLQASAQLVVVQLLSHVWLCNFVDSSAPVFPVLHYLAEFAQTHVRWVNDAIQPSHPLSPSSPPAFNLSQYQGLSQWVGSLHQVAKVLELQLQQQSFQWIFSTDSFKIGWFDRLSVKELSSLLRHHGSKASIFWRSDFFMVQPSHPYLITGKTIVLTIQTLGRYIPESLCFFKTLKVQDLEIRFGGPETNASSAATPDHAWKSWERGLSCGERSMLLLIFHEIISCAD